MRDIPSYEDTGYIPTIYADISWTGGWATIPWSKFFLDGNSLSSGNLKDGFLIGQVITQVLVLKLNNSDHYFDDKNLTNIRLYMQYDGHYDGYYEFGDYAVNSADDSYGDILLLTAKDPTGASDILFNNGEDAPYPAGSSVSINELYAEVLRNCGLADVSAHPPSYYNVAASYVTIPEGECTCRQILEFILQAIGRNLIYANHSNAVKIVGYKDNPLTTYATIDKQHTLSYARNGQTITGIQFDYVTKIGNTRCAQSIFSGSFSSGKVLMQNSPFVVSAVSAAAALTGTSNLITRKFSAEIPFSPQLEVMDRVKIIDWEGNEFFSYITGITHNFNGTTEIQTSV